MADTRSDRCATLAYSVLEGAEAGIDLAPGDAWSFGRDERCTETLVLPTLSRVALIVRCVEPGACRVSSRQSGLGRVVIDSDDGRERHIVALGSGPVHLFEGNYSVKVELPPIVLRMTVAIAPAGRQDAAAPARLVSPLAAAERTRVPWTPEQPGPDAPPWITVVALAVAVHRYPELAGQDRSSEALRRLCGLWCGHTSLYWVNERLKEAVEAADLVVPEGGERMALATAHYGQVFPQTTIRRLRDAILERQGAAP
jgi:hypothetical protein